MNRTISPVRNAGTIAGIFKVPIVRKIVVFLDNGKYNLERKYVQIVYKIG